MVEQHAAAEAFGGTVPGPPEARESESPPRPAPAPAPVVRTAPRVGRNDPCYCGSGKKYKKCHMLIDEGVESGT
jgi:preprotein translocase subunit SecA